MKKDVMRFIAEFFRKDRLNRGANASFTTLIPKVPNPSALGEYRLISFVGNLYRIIAKLLANKLKNVIGEIFEKNQFSFIQGRQILDCLLIANEVID